MSASEKVGRPQWVYSVEKLEIARTPDLDQLRMQSGMPSNHLRGHQPEVLHRDIDFTGYPLTYKEAPRPIGAAIFAASPEIEFFNRIGSIAVGEGCKFNLINA